ncbi:MAG: phytanoyl-CoA dioxygenase family protein [Myxococcota bacterium]
MTTPVELDRYREAGFFCRERVFSEFELAELREAVEGIHKRILGAAAGDDASPIDRVDRQRYQLLLGSTVKWEWREGAEEIRSMEPCHHLDRRIDGLIDDPRVWNPVRSVLGSEGLWVIPGSHKHGMLPCLENRGVLGRLYTDVERFEAEAAIPAEAPAGSVLYFHQDLVHGSQTNRSSQSRRVLVFAYQPAGRRQWRFHKSRPVDGA